MAEWPVCRWAVGHARVWAKWWAARSVGGHVDHGVFRCAGAQPRVLQLERKAGSDEWKIRAEGVCVERSSADSESCRLVAFRVEQAVEDTSGSGGGREKSNKGLMRMQHGVTDQSSGLSE
eukprot:1027521-Pleurochrysis_carterae.AAC.1